MHEINETLGLHEGESDLMQKMSIEEKLQGLEERFVIQNKFNEAMSDFIQDDKFGMIYHIFGTKLSWVESQLLSLSKRNDELQDQVDSLNQTVESNDKYTRSLERTIMQMLTGKGTSGGNGEQTEGKGGGLVGRILALEKYVDGDLESSLNELREADNAAKNSIYNIVTNVDEVKGRLDEEFSEENKVSFYSISIYDFDILF